MEVVVTTKDFCEEAKHYLESEGFEVVLRNRLGIGAVRLTTFCIPW